MNSPPRNWRMRLHFRRCSACEVDLGTFMPMAYYVPSTDPDPREAPVTRRTLRASHPFGMEKMRPLLPLSVLSSLGYAPKTREVDRCPTSGSSLFGRIVSFLARLAVFLRDFPQEKLALPLPSRFRIEAAIRTGQSLLLESEVLSTGRGLWQLANDKRLIAKSRSQSPSLLTT